MFVETTNGAKQTASERLDLNQGATEGGRHPRGYAQWRGGRGRGRRNRRWWVEDRMGVGPTCYGLPTQSGIHRSPYKQQAVRGCHFRGVDEIISAQIPVSRRRANRG